MNSYTVFSVSTIFHIMMAKLYIKEEKIKNAAIIYYSRNFPIEEKLARDKDFKKCIVLKRNDEKVRLKSMLINRKNINDLLKSIKELNCNELIVFKDNDIINQTLIDYCKKRNINTTLMEDGLGLYTHLTTTNDVIKINFLKRLLLNYPSQLYKNLAINPKIDNILVSSPNHLSNEKTAGKNILKLSFDNLSKEERIELFNYFNVNQINLSDSYSKGTLKLLFLGQPFSELKILSKETERRNLENLIDTLKKIEIDDFLLLIKPHPSEDLDKYNSLLYDEKVHIFDQHHIPAELIPSKIAFDAVLTVHSSSVFYMTKWYNIKSFSLYKLFIGNNQTLESQLTNIYEMRILNSYSELDKISIVKKK